MGHSLPCLAGIGFAQGISLELFEHSSNTLQLCFSIAINKAGAYACAMQCKAYARVRVPAYASASALGTVAGTSYRQAFSLSLCYRVVGFAYACLPCVARVSLAKFRGMVGGFAFAG